MAQNRVGRGEPGGPAPRPIGIIGCSAEGAALCYRTIVSMAGARLGGHRHPEITMHTPSLQQYVERLDARDVAGVGELMVASANVLTAAGADILICPDNTIHQALDHVLPHLSVPFLSIADVVATAAKARGAGAVGIMGTKWLVESDVYPKALARQGIACLRPNAEDIETVSRVIMDELVLGTFTAASTAALAQVVKRLALDGCDAVALVCTELPLVLSDQNAGLPTLDSTRLLAAAALDASLAP